MSGCSYLRDEFDVANLIQTKSEFSNAMTVMDTIGGWQEEGRGEGDERYDRSQRSEEDFRRVFGSIQKTTICNGQRHMGNLQGQEDGLNYGSNLLGLRHSAG